MDRKIDYRAAAMLQAEWETGGNVDLYTAKVLGLRCQFRIGALTKDGKATTRECGNTMPCYDHRELTPEDFK